MEAAKSADIVCTCVSDPAALEGVLLGDQGAIAGAAPSTLFIDFSTMDPDTSRRVADAAEAAGCEYLEAPVSGGVKGAESSSLTIIAGGPVQSYERALPVLEMVGSQITRVGEVGAGSTIKLINQMLVGANLAAVLEAFVLGKRAGISPQVLYDIVRASSGNSGMLNRAVPGNLLPRNFDPGFTVGLLLKDLRLAAESAGALDMSLQMVEAAQRVFEEAQREGLQDQDMTAAVLPMERRYGVEVVEVGLEHGNCDASGGGGSVPVVIGASGFSTRAGCCDRVRGGRTIGRDGRGDSRSCTGYAVVRAGSACPMPAGRQPHATCSRRLRTAG